MMPVSLLRVARYLSSVRRSLVAIRFCLVVVENDQPQPDAAEEEHDHENDERDVRTRGTESYGFLFPSGRRHGRTSRGQGMGSAIGTPPGRRVQKHTIPP